MTIEEIKARLTALEAHTQKEITEMRKDIEQLSGGQEPPTEPETPTQPQKVFSYPFNTDKVDTGIWYVTNPGAPAIKFDEVANVGLKVLADGASNITDPFANMIKSKQAFGGDTSVEFDFNLAEVSNNLHQIGFYVDEKNYAVFSRVNEPTGERIRTYICVDGATDKDNTEVRYADYDRFAILVKQSSIDFFAKKHGELWHEIGKNYAKALPGKKHLIISTCNSVAGAKTFKVSNMDVLQTTDSTQRPDEPEPPMRQGDGFSLKNQSYSWWCSYISVYEEHTRHNYLTTVDISGAQMLHAYDNSTDKIQTVTINSGLSTDEHNTAAFLILGDEILTAFNGHNIDNFWIRRFDKATLQPKGAKMDIAKSSGFNDASYAQLYNADGRLFLLCRNAWHAWKIAWSDDGGYTWGKAKTLVSRSNAAKLYLNGKQSGSTIHFAVYSHPVEQGNNNKIYVLDFDTTTGKVYNNGSDKGNLYNSAWKTLAVTSLKHVYDSGNRWLRMLDFSLSGNSQYNLLVADFDSSYDDGMYSLLEVNRSTQAVTKRDIVAHGRDTFRSYFGGAYFVQDYASQWNGRIFLARESGGTWYAEEYAYSGGKFSKVRTIDSLPAGSAGLSITRPKPPINSQAGGVQVVYQKGDYDESYKKWKNEMIATT